MLQDNYLIKPQQVMIECVIKHQGTSTILQNPFDQQDFLTNRPIIGLQVFCDEDITNSPLGSNLPVIPASLLTFAFLNIQRSGYGPVKAGVWYKNIPLCSLRNVINFASGTSANLDMFRCDPMIMQWRDSNVSFPTPGTQTVDYSVPFLVTYLLEHQDPTPYRMAFLKK